ncbi:transporter substrate-binding domain-containing protein [Burkholderia cenocepacia]|uniref:ATP-binding protein n=1 Tax=Burkholderia cenocepacia TaxID=95486 RepID=UPI0023B922F0|nr:transporter substrate-binding domain-containing protein [Burkholderia cenocepacia]MDF0506710.1 transporter substrate-binding domain-containing protein [Burkholderia cenocepacia]
MRIPPHREAHLFLFPFLFLLLSWIVPADAAVGKHLPALLRRPEIVVGVVAHDARMPFERADTSGRLEGFSGDYLQALLRDVPGLRVVTRTFDDVPSMIAAACRGDVDLVISVDVTPAGRGCLAYSEPYLRDNAAFLGLRRDRRAADDDRLRRARIGVVSGSMFAVELRERYPGATIVSLRPTEIVSAVRQRRVDVFFGASSILDYLLATTGADRELDIIRRMPDTHLQVHFAAGLQHADFIRWVNVRQRDVPNSTIRGLMDRWFGVRFGTPVPSLNVQLNLTDDDRAYLHALPTLRLGYGSQWSPVTSVGTDGRLQGLASDYIDYLSRTLGIRFERSPIDRWSAILDAFRRDDVDIIVGARNSVPADLAAIRSDPLDTFPLVLVLPQSASTVTSLRDIKGLRVGVLNGRIEGRDARENLPGAIVVPVRSDVDGMEQTASGAIDAYVANIAVADLMVATRYVGRLRTSIPIGRQQDVLFMMQPKFAHLNDLITRALATLPDSERIRARNEWLTARYTYGVSWSQVVSRLMPVALIGAAAFGLILLAYFRQRAEARRRTVAENQLEMQVRIQNALMEALPYPVLAVGGDGRFMFVNHAALDMLGSSRDKMLAHTVDELARCHPVVHETFAAANGESTRQRAGQLNEIHCRDRDGVDRTMLYRIAHFDHANKPKPGTIVALVDITDTRVAQEHEAQAAHRLGDLTRNLPAVVFQARRAADGKRSFPFVGGNTAPLFGVSPERLMEHESYFLDVIVPEDREVLLGAVERSAHMLNPVRGTFRTQVHNTVRWVRTMATPVGQPDGSVLWSGYWVDITAERRQADALRAARDLALKASNAKDEFLAMMSHEIRTPMNGVLGLIELLGKTEVDEAQAHMLALVQESASTLLQVLDDILDYSKIEAGQLMLEPTEVDIRRLCDGVLGLLAGPAREKGIALRVIVDARAASAVHVDGVRLRQVLFNLLGNAIKFTERGSVTLRVCMLDDGPVEQRIAFSIEDTGIGISAEQQSVIFAPFSQADASINRRFGGTGLGLAICNRLVQMMGGTIELTSQQGRGTTVVVTFVLPVDVREMRERPLAGVGVRIVSGAADVVSGLREYLRVLGADIVAGDADLTVVCEPDAGGPCAQPTIVLSDRFKAAGTWEEHGMIHLCANPLLFSVVGFACRRLLLTESPERESRAAAASADPSPATAGGADRHGARVLVAEDNPINREVKIAQMKMLGYPCDVAADGIEALRMYRTGRYAILLTDCHMPLLDGFQLARTIRAEEAGTGKRLPIIGVTASTLERDRVNCTAAGMDGCLTKPVGLRELERCLEKWLRADEAGTTDVPTSAPAGLPAVDEPVAQALNALYPDDGDRAAFVRLFVTQFGADLEALARANALDDLGEQADLLHRIAGSLSVLGLRAWQDEIAALRRSLGRLPRAARRTQLDRIVERGQQFGAALTRRFPAP